jgi:UDP-2,3-diacylglucosamine pyrophosphatase LpxH
MQAIVPAAPRYRALFLSDVHLGTKASRAGELVEFLRAADAETIYLVGDIIDGWALKGGWYWPQSHNDVAQKILRKARKGARVVYLPGNHDEFLRGFYGTHLGGIEVQETAIHTSASGERYLVLHGDAFDFVIRHAKWLAHLGDAAYDFALFLNRIASAARRRIGMPYWSLSAWAKLKVKNAVNVISAFEDALAAEARRVGAHGVICGHIHHAVSRDIGGVRYMNTGDWVESLTALVEYHDGRFEIIRWADRGGPPRSAERLAAEGGERDGCGDRLPEPVPEAVGRRLLQAAAAGRAGGARRRISQPITPAISEPMMTPIFV